MLQSNVSDSAAAWTVREKLCLASCVMRMSENWSSVSKQMKLLADERRPADFFSQKNCAQEYTSLIESLGVQKRKRSESTSSGGSSSIVNKDSTGYGSSYSASAPNNYSASSGNNSNLPLSAGPNDSPAAQLVSKLTLERLDELKRIISAEKSLFKKTLKEIEAIKNGEMDNELDAIEEEMDREERNLSNSYHKSAAKGDESSSPNVKPSPATIGAEKIEPANNNNDQAMTSSRDPLSSLTTFSHGVVKREATTGQSVVMTSLTASANSVSAPLIVGQTAEPVVVNALLSSPIRSAINISPSKNSSTFGGGVIQSSSPFKVENLHLIRPELISPPPTSAAAPPTRVMSDQSASVDDGGVFVDPASASIGSFNVCVSRRDESSSAVAAGTLPNVTPVSSTSPAPSDPEIPTSSTTSTTTASSIPPPVVGVDQRQKSIKQEQQDDEAAGDVFHYPGVPLGPAFHTAESTNQQKAADHMTKIGDNQCTPHGQQPAPVAKRQKRDSGGSTASSEISGSLGSIGGGGGAPSVTSSSRSPHPVPAHFADFDSYRVWKRTILNVHNVAAGHKHANLFYKPVQDEQAPFYSKLIRRPMCLNDIKRNIETQSISTTVEFKRDLLLVFADAVMYNPRSHDVHQMALQMAADTLPLIDELLGSNLIGGAVGQSATSAGHATKSVVSSHYTSTASDQSAMSTSVTPSHASTSSVTHSGVFSHSGVYSSTAPTPSGTGRNLRAHRSSIVSLLTAGHRRTSVKRDNVEKAQTTSRKRENSVTNESTPTPKLKRLA